MNPRDLDHYDHLVNSKGQLAGFVYVLEDAQKVALIPMISQSRNVRIEEDVWLKFVLAESDPLQTDGAQVLWTNVYYDGSCNYILALYDAWPTSKSIAFEMQESDVPLFKDQGN